MENKNIIFTAPGIAEVVSKEMPVLGPGQVLVRIITTTISAGTERANLVGNPNVRGVMAPDVSFPRQVGYSAGAIVEAVGEGVESVKVGDRVACGWTVHAQYCVLPENRVHLLPDDVSFAEAALVHIVTFPMAAIRKCRLEMGESAIVMGQGVLGMIAVELLRIAGAAPIIAVDPVAEKRELALKRGADYALDPFASDFVETVNSLTGGGAKVVIEVTGSGSGLDMVLDCMARYGRIALLGCTRDPNFTIDYYRKVHCPGITLIGAHTFARPPFDSAPGWFTEEDDRKTLLNFYRFGRLKLSNLVEETRKPEETPAVYQRLAEEPFFPLVQFDWRGEE